MWLCACNSSTRLCIPIAVHFLAFLVIFVLLKPFAYSRLHSPIPAARPPTTGIYPDPEEYVDAAAARKLPWRAGESENEEGVWWEANPGRKKSHKGITINTAAYKPLPRFRYPRALDEAAKRVVARAEKAAKAAKVAKAAKKKADTAKKLKKLQQGGGAGDKKEAKVALFDVPDEEELEAARKGRLTETGIESNAKPLNEPSDVAVDPCDNYIVADTGNHCIRILGRKYVAPEEYPDRYIHEIPNRERWMWRPCDWKAAVGNSRAARAVAARDDQMRNKHYADLASAAAKPGSGSGVAKEKKPTARRQPIVAPAVSAIAASASTDDVLLPDFDADGNPLVVDPPNVDPLGRLFCRVVPGVRVELVASFGSLGDTPGFFRSPMGVACYSTSVEQPLNFPSQIDVSEQHIVVSDTGNNRVQVLRYIGDELCPLHPAMDINAHVKKVVEGKSVLGRKMTENDRPKYHKNGWTKE